jgi:hypothetical protein
MGGITPLKTTAKIWQFPLDNGTLNRDGGGQVAGNISQNKEGFIRGNITAMLHWPA